MPFTEKSLDFLFINKMNDSREWYNAHKDEYKRLVAEPLKELSEALAPEMLAIDPLFNTAPKVGGTLSRIYRDTRFSRDKSLFRDSAWVSFKRPRADWHGAPEYFFELSPRGLAWGCGWYEAAPETMQEMRRQICARTALWQDALAAYGAQTVFVLDGERRKRSLYPDMPERERDWLDRKSVCLIAQSFDTDRLFAPELAAHLAEQFAAIAPIYAFLLDCFNKGRYAAE